MNYLLALVVALLIQGCASIPGQKLAEKQSALEPQEPWQSVVLWDLNLRETSCLTVVPILLPAPLPTILRWEHNDHRRLYGDGRVLRRDVWRVVTFDGTAVNRVYNAVLGSDRRALYELVPGCGREIDDQLIRQQHIVVSADACFVMTTRQDIVPLREFGKLPEGFFENHPSPLRAASILHMGNDTLVGKRFLEGLREKFPKLISGRHSARADVADVSVLTAEVAYGDRFVSKGSLPISAALFAGPVSPMFLVGTAVRNREVFSGLCSEAHEMLGLKLETAFRERD